MKTGLAFFNSPPFFFSTLQDEMEELRSEMLEMRDMYMEDDVYQLQELRQQLEQVRSRRLLFALQCRLETSKGKSGAWFKARQRVISCLIGAF